MQFTSTKEFQAAKSGATSKEKPDPERYDLEALGRLNALVSSGYHNYYIQSLVDGVDFSSRCRIIPEFQRTEEQRILISYNFLKELEYLCQCGVIQPDIGSNNTMIDKNGYVYFVDFGGGYRSSNDNGKRTARDINEEKIESVHVSMMYSLWEDIKEESKKLEGTYSEFVQKILPKKSLYLGSTLEMLEGLMKENNHPMILKVKLSKN